MEMNDISGLIVDRAIHIHRALGPGLLESVYHRNSKVPYVSSSFFVIGVYSRFSVSDYLI